MALTAYKPDALEHFISEASADNSTDHVDRVLLALDVALPGREDVFQLVHVDVPVLAIRPNVERLFKLPFKLFFGGSGLLELLLHVLNITLLVESCRLMFLDELALGRLLVTKLPRQRSLAYLVGLLGP